MFVLTQVSFSQKKNLKGHEFEEERKKVMGSIPIRDSEVFSSEKKKLMSTRTFLLHYLYVENKFVDAQKVEGV